MREHVDNGLVVVIGGNPRPHALTAIKMMAALVTNSPYMSMPPMPIPIIKPGRPYSVLCCKNCQSTGTLQKIDGALIAAEIDRLQRMGERA